ncbi:MAG: PorT family protein [Lentimicrobium sp.]|jgi:hypothetical protein|nr:PorT family protein [Lentimicrobium sp.]MDD4596701.1 porin family protein [Lentimicrobiaceae bacterium]MDY0024934.1 porin family protein [Lentimicrobium sp.]
MRKLLLTFLLIPLLYGQVSGQELIVGIKGGPVVSGLLYSNFTPKTGHRLGFSAGISLLKPISAHKDLGVELMYDQRGYSDQFTYTNLLGEIIGTFEYTYLFDYIALPCYVRFQTSKDIKWFLDLGLSPSYMISARTRSHTMDFDGNKGPQRKYKFDPDPFYMSRFDIAALIGGGVQFKIRDNIAIDLNLRYTNGLLSIFDRGLFEQYMLINSLNFSVGANYTIK